MGFINSGVILAQPNGRPTNLSGKDIFKFIAEPVAKLVQDDLLDKQNLYPQNSSFIDEVGKHSFVALAGIPTNFNDDLKKETLSVGEVALMEASKSYVKKVHFDNNIRVVPTDYFKNAEQINTAV